MVITYVLVAMAIPLLLLVTPERPAYVYIFAILFGFALGADYMLIPLMAADQFGVPTLVRAMGVILPFDTIGQTWFPYFRLRIANAVRWLRPCFRGGIRSRHGWCSGDRSRTEAQAQ